MGYMYLFKRIVMHLLTITLLLVFVSSSSADNTVVNYNNFTGEFDTSAPIEFQRMFWPRHIPENYDKIKLLKSSSTDWRILIDFIWGEGSDITSKMSMFNNWWVYLDEEFPGFNGLDPNVWQNVHDTYWPEILNNDVVPVSKGRFCAIMQYSFFELQDAHTFVENKDVTTTDPLPGIPLFVGSNIGIIHKFGAGLTPLPDSSLLVYKVFPSHVLGLEPGDIVLGYDNRLWKDIYPELLDAQLPIAQAGFYTAPEAISHILLGSAGQNCHLYDTIDVIKYDTKDTVHLATAPIFETDMTLWASEQMDITGVPQPDAFSDELFSWGIMDGTNIAYIYTLGWWGNEEELIGEWNAVFDSIMNYYNCDGLIIDDRVNWGSSLISFLTPLNMLFDTTVNTLDWYRRCSMADHFNMCEYSIWWNDSIAVVHGDPETFYNKPIAVLTGPNAVSGGDFFPFTISFHPNVKFFGKPTNGAFSSTYFNDGPTWFFQSTFTEATREGVPGELMVRTGFPDPNYFNWVDYEEVWLTPDMVAQGRDDVVEAAVAWIMTGDDDADGVLNYADNCMRSYNPDQSDWDANGQGDICDDCCRYARGNINGDANDELDIEDLVYFIDYFFNEGDEPVCQKECDVNNDESIDISDIVYLIDYMFNEGDEPMGCI